VCLALGLGCRLREPIPAEDAPAPAEAAALPWQEDLLAAAQAYRSWRRVTDAHWAPWQCFLPPPSGARRSKSADEGTHGGKLFFLYTEDSNFYGWVLPRGVKSPMGTRLSGPAPTGFVIVKESWSPIEVDIADVPRLPVENSFDRTIPAEYLIEVPRAYRTDKLQGLFIMLKKDPGTPGTDEGWVYGTVSADGRTVTSSGRVQACMRCHQNASRDRLFGMHMDMTPRG